MQLFYNKLKKKAQYEVVQFQDGTEIKAFVAESQGEVVAVAVIRVEEVRMKTFGDRT